MSGAKEDDISGIKTTVKKFEEIMLKKGVEGLREELNNNLQAWQNTKLNIGVVGNTGAGKSTLINAILGLDHTDENAAAAGILEETVVIKPFSGKNKNVVFWDLPGVGTPKFPKIEYADKVKLERFDFVILVARLRFTENDVWLSRKIKAIGKKFCFVRTHLEEDIENDSKAKPKSHDRQKCIDNIRKDCSENLEEVAPVDIFLIDSYECDQYDFDSLIKQLFRDFEGIKANLLAVGLASFTQAVIDTKAEFLRSRAIFVSVGYAERHTKDTADALATEVLQAESQLYKEVFGIDSETLKKDRDLFSLSEIASNVKIHELEVMSKNLTEVSERGLEIYRKELETIKSPFNWFLSVEKIGFGLVIQALLENMIARFHHFASNIFQNIPIEFAQRCLVTDDQTSVVKIEDDK